jgi:hypothetical protein
MGIQDFPDIRAMRADVPLWMSTTAGCVDFLFSPIIVGLIPHLTPALTGKPLTSSSHSSTRPGVLSRRALPLV